jgi:ATP-binding cassette subfamily B protein
MAYFENQRTGNLMSVLNEDINQMERFLNGGANQIIQVICSSIMVSAVFFALQPSCVISLLPVPAILFGAFWFQKRLAPRYAEVREAAGDVSARLNNNLLGLPRSKRLRPKILKKSHCRSQQYLSPSQCCCHCGQRCHYPGYPHGDSGRLYRHAGVRRLADLA